MRIITYHGTVLYRDEATHEIRHGDFYQSPGNLTACVGQNGLTLSSYALEGSFRFFFNGLRSHAVPIPDENDIHSSLNYQIDNKGAVSITCNGLYLCAEPDGRITLSRSDRSAWEMFAFFDDETLDYVKRISNKKWLSLSRREVITPSTFRILSGFECVLCNYHTTLSELRRSIRLSPNPLANGSVVIPYGSYRVDILKPFAPLIYFCAFGSDSIFDCLNTSLSSLDHSGNWTGDLLIICDRTRESTLQHVPERLRERTHVMMISAGDTLDYTISRCKVMMFDRVASFSPIIYCDTDIIFDGCIDQLAINVCLSDKLAVLGEGILMANHQFYGESLISRDEHAVPSIDQGFSSGCIGIPRIEIAEPVFIAATLSAYEAVEQMSNRNIYFYDQAFLNYVMHKMHSFSYDVLEPFLRAWSLDHYDTSPTIDNRKGMTHFTGGGIGNGARKLKLMKEYLSKISSEIFDT